MTGEKETWIEEEPRLSSIPPSLDSGMMASDSLPSPTIARDGPVAIPPLARSGISGSVNPSVCPPAIGTQSGIFAFASWLIPLNALLICVIAPVYGVLAIAGIEANTPEKVVFMPSHALVQSPKKTPDMKSVKPWKVVLTASTFGLITFS